jgi:hypothetical protein
MFHGQESNSDDMDADQLDDDIIADQMMNEMGKSNFDYDDDDDSPDMKPAKKDNSKMQKANSTPAPAISNNDTKMSAFNNNTYAEPKSG